MQDLLTPTSSLLTPHSPMPTPFLTTRQASQLCGVHASTIKRWIRQGVIHAFRTVGGHRDPTVDRKGIQYLQDSGVDVHMFDRDLQEVIQEANKDFFAQAMERAKEAKERKQIRITLSKYEEAFDNARLEDLSVEALVEYRTRARVTDDVDSIEFKRLLLQQGFLKEENGGLTPTGFGFLLFGRKPRRVVHQAGILAIINYANGSEERREFDEPMVLIPDLVEGWLSNKLPDIMDRGRMRRKNLPALQFELVREGLVNALIHRDYDIAGAKCQLEVNKDTVTIRSPGKPPPPVTLEQLQTFTAPMLSRNPALHYVFGQMELAEEQGLGIKSLRSGAEALGLPLPRYTWNDPYLALTLFRTPESVSQGLAAGVLDKMNKDQRAAWQFATTKETMTSRELMNELRCDYRKAQRVIKKLMELNLLRRVGKGPATRYELV